LLGKIVVRMNFNGLSDSEFEAGDYLEYSGYAWKPTKISYIFWVLYEKVCMRIMRIKSTLYSMRYNLEKGDK